MLPQKRRPARLRRLLVGADMSLERRDMVKDGAGIVDEVEVDGLEVDVLEVERLA